MKSVAAYYLILLYAVAVCKPFLPLVKDTLAHTFWSAAHFEQVHHTHGANHVHHELKQTATQESETTRSLVSEPVAIHIPVQTGYYFSCAPFSSPVPPYNSCPVRSLFLETHTPPPKA